MKPGLLNVELGHFGQKILNAKKWNDELSKFCPGINKGKLISKKEINKIIKEDEDK